MAFGSGDRYPWCAAKKCPAQHDCTGYITKNHGNQTAQNFVACCEILCGRSANEMLVALQCGGATTATAWGIIFYLLLLLFAGAYILIGGPFVRGKWVTYLFVTIGSLIFSAGTFVFVTNATSPFRVLQSVPALGAMNVTVFLYFLSGFQYEDYANEGVLGIVCMNAISTIWKEAIESTPEHWPVLHGNRIALAMLVIVFFRLAILSNEREAPNFQLGVVQGYHRTWRTPMGQSSGVVLTALAWAVTILVKKDLALQRCRPDWVFHVMLYGAPCLISSTVLCNVFSGTRCR